MSREIPEQDWKTFRQLQPMLINRFCERALNDLMKTATGPATHHARFLKIYELIDEQNEELGRAFDNLRRSTALLQLATMHSLNLFTNEEFMQFSPETRALMDSLLSFSQTR